MIKKSIKKIFSFFGLDIRFKQKYVQIIEVPLNSEMNPFVGFDYAEDGYKAVKIIRDYSMLADINLLTLFEQAVYCEKNQIDGAYVECGVWKGGAVGIMAKANLDFASTRRHLHLFDVFDNIGPPDADIDGKRAIDDTKKAGFTDETKMQGQLESMEGAYDSLGGHGTIQICKTLLEGSINYPKEYIHYHKGWFQETLPMDAPEIESIAILRLDGDYYKSIKICLDYLYDKVTKGGLIVIDDYKYYDGCTKAVDEFLEERKIRTFLSYSRIGCRYFVKP